MRKARIAVLVSGTGRSLENLAAEVAGGRLPVELVLVMSDRPGVLALERAERLGIEALVVPHKECNGPEDFSARVVRELDARECDLVVLAGFLRLLLLPPEWRGRAINIHPALLPAFGGKGFYGDRVHAAVLAAGVPETGCTVHYVNDRYDEGAIILQRRIPVLPDDTVETLAKRVFAEECVALPEAIRRVVAGLDERHG